MAVKDQGDAYRIKILLADTRPAVWRRLEIPATLSLARLHRAIQAVFGWEDDHGHVFRIRGTEYGEVGTEGAFGLRAERVSLAGLGFQPGDTLSYEYGLEDAWTHQITVEDRFLPETPLRIPRCAGGKGACPPEGPGGPFGYRERLAAAANPRHPDHPLARASFPKGWRPEAFDLGAANDGLRAIFTR